MYHKSGILNFEVDHPGSPKPFLGISKSSGFFKKINFFNFFLVFDPNTLGSLTNPTFGGVKLLKLFGFSNSLKVENAKIGLFFGRISHKTSITIAQIKKFQKFDHPKSVVSETN